MDVDDFVVAVVSGVKVSFGEVVIVADILVEVVAEDVFVVDGSFVGVVEMAAIVVRGVEVSIAGVIDVGGVEDVNAGRALVVSGGSVVVDSG